MNRFGPQPNNPSCLGFSASLLGKMPVFFIVLGVAINQFFSYDIRNSTWQISVVSSSRHSQFIRIYMQSMSKSSIWGRIFFVANFSFVSTFLLNFFSAEGTGNDDISLQCPGTLKVIRVRAFGIPGDNGTVADFDKHCQANLGLIDGTNVCIVSLKRVYKTSYPPFIKTLVTFTCSYTEFAS